ncbi:MAG: CBS domain-containing protein [Chromatiaceae bacterium]|jgi:CBS domain-containing protein
MKTIQNLLDQKGTLVWSIGPEATVYEALALMAEKGVGALVVRGDTRPLGLFSERDYARNVILKGRTSHDTPVREIMSSPVLCVTPEQPLEEAMALMTEHRVRHLPVIRGDEVLGMVSIGDLIKSIISEQKFIIEQLEHYISS